MQLLDVFAELNSIASFDLCEQWDNSGIIIYGDEEISNVLITLDVTSKIIDEAVAKKCQLIISHHPIMFKSVQKLGSKDLAYRLAKNNISLVCMHTNLDKAIGGVNDVLCKKLALRNIEIFSDMGRKGTLDFPKSVVEFARDISKILKAPVKYSLSDIIVSKVAVIGGSAGNFWELVVKDKLDVLVTGEISYHEALDAAHAGIPVIAAGHYETENLIVKELCHRMQNAMPHIGWNETENNTNPYEYIQM